MELEALQEAHDDFKAAGATLVAISPQLMPYNSELIKEKKLTFEIFSDPGNKLAHSYRLVHVLPPELREVYLKFGIDVPMHNGDESWSLPLAARFIIDQQCIIRYAEYDADYTVRPEMEHTLSALKHLGETAPESAGKSAPKSTDEPAPESTDEPLRRVLKSQLRRALKINPVDRGTSKMVKVYTGTGDGGKTSLFSGERVSKSTDRIEAYGDADELNSVIGALYGSFGDVDLDLTHELLQIQAELFAIGAWLATSADSTAADALAPLSHVPAARLETSIDRMDAG